MSVGVLISPLPLKFSRITIPPLTGAARKFCLIRLAHKLQPGQNPTMADAFSCTHSFGLVEAGPQAENKKGKIRKSQPLI
jgi:hypothetical protein